MSQHGVHPSLDAYEALNGAKQPIQLEKCFIGKLTPEDGHDKLSWASEHLSLNIAAYRSQEDDFEEGSWDIVRSHWAETDGGMDMIEHMLQHQGDASAGRPDAHYIRNPVRPFRLFVMETATEWMMNVHLSGLVGDFDSAYDIADLTERKPLAYLCLALSTGIEHEFDAHYIRDLEEWPACLLRRYISAAGLLKGSQPADLQKTSLGTLRLIVMRVLFTLAFQDQGAVLRLAPKISVSNTPSDLHRDLLLGLAWGHGRLPKLAWCTLLRTGTLRIPAISRDADTAQDIQADGSDCDYVSEGEGMHTIDHDDGPVVEDVGLIERESLNWLDEPMS